MPHQVGVIGGDRGRKPRWHVAEQHFQQGVITEVVLAVVANQQELPPGLFPLLSGLAHEPIDSYLSASHPEKIEPMHALSLPTWWIHITSVLEWVVALLAVQRLGVQRREGGWRWLSLAMLPALISAMAACTWHLFDNSPELYGLVVFQAGLTAIGNAALALAAWNLLRQQRQVNS